ncbi:uncharacterized protein si:ch211-79k12.1 [Lampris incognitus]|uniref:uncharacterized protein si:ch211-79k12.1 n=1 Tax=Lampris incognitus TaxID=2546036 RepID=UPI0024B60ABC|nr:uncharacterized protein si:ch211-79k12.1 [Lampris incognitus]
MKGLRGILLIALIHSAYASLTIKGPSQPILEGDGQIQLECLFSDLNSSQVHFELFLKYREEWVRLDDYYFGFRCFRYSWDVEREEGRLLLRLFRSYINSYMEGPYRCVYDANSSIRLENSTTSETLSLKVHYMRRMMVYRGDMGRYLGAVENLKVPLGANVDLECTATSSESPEYSWQRKDAAWYESSNGRLMLMTSAAATALLVLILTMSVFMCRRGKQVKSGKGPIDDHSQKKPIYKASVESLPSTCGDKQPLV